MLPITAILLFVNIKILYYKTSVILCFTCLSKLNRTYLTPYFKGHTDDYQYFTLLLILNLGSFLATPVPFGGAMPRVNCQGLFCVTRSFHSSPQGQGNHKQMRTVLEARAQTKEIL